ncbi:MAG: sulfite exporter TauE/SafE family protein [Phycisphaerales bacterium]|nr:sulfite exporter TauE/SafE family protein [Phycisphaerales bacterium]MCB9855705.1 sulfite exporter TauE/SafE family protein [Phycisphaerales bacterium]MCB9862600.1 sulfite exporter TauE/SafE family protein [Phycisphaerales bacterium]
MTAELGTVFAMSFLGSAHCIGMCGGLAAAVGASKRRMAPIVARQLVYTAGRITTYTFLGALAGYAGQAMARADYALFGVQQAFSIAAGVIMLLVGLSVLGLIPGLGKKGGGVARLIAKPFAYFLNAEGWWGYYIAGVATGFLPCSLVYALLALAVAAASVPQGMLIMAIFGLGTAPAMLAVGCGSSLISQRARSHVFKVAAVFMLFMGGATIYRAWPNAEGESCCSPSPIIKAAQE